MLALWILPLLVVAPLFSRDVFSYAAQGEMMSRHINPYHYGPGTLGSGPYVNGVDPLWANTPAPYGPLFLMLAGWSASLSLHHALVTVVLLRLQSVAGIALIAYCIPKLARSFGRDPGPAFVLAVLNPLTLLALVGGAHNDAIMVGLLLAGVTAARSFHPAWGVVLCALAASIKVPAAIGIVYVAWEWAGPFADWRRRARMVVRSGLITVAVMGVLSLVSGLGWGWIANLGTPGTVRSWMAPATGFGLLISGTAHVVGIGVGLGGVLTLTRAIGLIAAAVIAIYCLRNRERIGLLGALGATMMAFVLLGPVVQPWYLTWGIIIVAPIVTGRWLYAVLGLSAVAPFIGLTGGADLLSELVHTDPASMVLAVMVLWAVAIFPLGNWTTSWRIDRSRLAALPAAERGTRILSGSVRDLPPGADLQQPLQLDHVEPLPVLAPDLTFHSHQLEARRPVQADGGLVVPGDPGDQRVEAVGGGQDEQLVEESLADAPAPLGAVDIDGILGGGRVPRALTEGRERAEAEDDLAVGPDPDRPPPGPPGSVATRAGWTPLCSRIQASCSARVRGTMSNVFVLSRTSTL